MLPSIGVISGAFMIRVLLAGLAGAIAMFIWVSIAHVMTPLGSMGFSQIPNERPVLDAMQASLGNHAGMYFFPWVDPKDPQLMQKSAALMKTNPSGLLVYQGPGGKGDMTLMLAHEFVKEFIEALIAAFLLSLTMLGSYLARAGFVALIGVCTAIATNVSYWIWYAFSADYTLAQIVIELVGMIVVGLVAAAIVRPRAAQS